MPSDRHENRPGAVVGRVLCQLSTDSNACVAGNPAGELQMIPQARVPETVRGQDDPCPRRHADGSHHGAVRRFGIPRDQLPQASPTCCAVVVQRENRPPLRLPRRRGPRRIGLAIRRRSRQEAMRRGVRDPSVHLELLDRHAAEGRRGQVSQSQSTRAVPGPGLLRHVRPQTLARGNALESTSSTRPPAKAADCRGTAIAPAGPAAITITFPQVVACGFHRKCRDGSLWL